MEKPRNVTRANRRLASENGSGVRVGMRGFSGQRASGAHMRMGADTFITRETPSQWIAANGSRYRKSDLMEVCTRGGQRYFVPLLNDKSDSR